MDEAQIIRALDLAQCELRAMYKKLGYQDSNVLREIDAVHEALTKQKKLNKHDVMCSYLILDKTNKVVSEKATLEEAEIYVKARPYLKYEKFEQPTENVACDLDDIL